jgi:hypothetical protein
MVRSEPQFQYACRVRSLASHSDEWHVAGQTKPFASSEPCRPLQRSKMKVGLVVLGRYKDLPGNVKIPPRSVRSHTSHIKRNLTTISYRA